ncbi:fibronectin type III-like domain-contianing protein [Oerskovia sp. M15]
MRPFGFGLSYTTFGYTDLTVDAGVAAGDTFTARVTVTNTGDIAGTEVVQLYGHDVLASVTRPTVQLLGYQRVALEPGGSAVVDFTVPTTRLAFSDRALTRVVEPGDVEIWVGAHARASAADGGRPSRARTARSSTPVPRSCEHCRAQPRRAPCCA